MRRLALVAALGTAAIGLAKLPILGGYGLGGTAASIGDLQPVHLSGSTLFISDLHLTDSNARLTLDMKGIEHLVIVGDLFHSPAAFERFGKTDIERIRRGLDVFVPDSYAGTIYSISSYNHDPDLPLLKVEHRNARFSHMGKYGKFIVNGVPVLAFHSDELYGGVVGGGVSWLSQRLGYLLPLERNARERLDIPEDTWLITAHSHVPAVRPEYKLGNTGPLAGVPLNAIFRVQVGTGIVFDGTDVRLLKFDGVSPSLY